MDARSHRAWNCSASSIRADSREKLTNIDRGSPSGPIAKPEECIPGRGRSRTALTRDQAPLRQSYRRLSRNRSSRYRCGRRSDPFVTAQRTPATTGRARRPAFATACSRRSPSTPLRTRVLPETWSRGQPRWPSRPFLAGEPTTAPVPEQIFSRLRLNAPRLPHWASRPPEISVLLKAKLRLFRPPLRKSL
jgi:hypothetical protein